MKEDLSITRISNDKIQVDRYISCMVLTHHTTTQAENRKLKGELEKLRKVEKKTESISNSNSAEGQNNEKGEKRMSFVQVSKLFIKL